MTFRTAFRYAKGEFEEVMQEIYQPIAGASTGAVREAGRIAQLRARETIANAGFSRRWQNALRLAVYPKKGESVNAAALIYHAVPYSEVFETGATIRGKPMLWVPLSTTPKKIGGRRMTAERFATSVGDLITLRRGNRTFLAARMRVSKREADAGPPYKIRLSALSRASQQGRGSIVTVPVFVGVDTVKIGKKFNVRAAIESAVNDLPELYLKFLKVD